MRSFLYALVTAVAATGIADSAVAQEFRLGNYSGGYAPNYAPGPTYHAAAPAACSGPDCGHCCPSHCSTGCCLHRSGIFAECLYWQVSDIDMVYAVPQDGLGRVGTVPVGDVGYLDFDYDAALRTGFNFALDCQSSITVTYTKFETNTHDDLAVADPLVVQPLVMLPATFNAGATAQSSFAEYSLEMELIDLDYRAVLRSCPRYHLNFLLGARYGQMDQSFTSAFFFAPPDGTTFVQTEVDFDGAGVRAGLDGECALVPRLGIRGYGKVAGSLMGGDFRCRYVQSNQFNGFEGVTALRESRLVPVGEAEFGLGWRNCKDTLRFSAGYYFGVWGNMVTTAEWIDSVQTGSFTQSGHDEDDTIHFDGLVARAELRL